MWWLSDVRRCQILLEGLLEHAFLGSSLRDPNSVSLEHGLRICISDKSPGCGSTPGSELRESQPYTMSSVAVCSSNNLITSSHMSKSNCHVPGMVLSDAHQAKEAMTCGVLLLTRGGCLAMCLNANRFRSGTTTFSGLHSTGFYGEFDKTCQHTALWSSRSNFKYISSFQTHKSL